MAEKPILFSGEMVRAILDGRKTETRRVVIPQPSGIMAWHEAIARWSVKRTGELYKDKYGRPGDLLWVRETWQAQNLSGQWWHEVKKEDRELYNWSVIDRAECENREPKPPKWIPSIFMPRWASRLTLEVTAVRVERLQDISEGDAKAEGVTASIVGYDLDHLKYRARFVSLWDSINSKRGYGWDVNPFVWVVEFKLNK